MKTLSQALKTDLVAVLNTGSGSCDETSEGRIARVFEEAGVRARIVVTGPADIEKALNTAIDEAGIVAVLGGDGTLRAAAEKCGAAGKPLIPLPGGTMNMLPRALYGDLGWEALLAKVLERPALRDVSGGLANGQLFFCAAILGAPSLWADAREAVRRGDLAEAARRSVTAIQRRTETVGYKLGDHARGRGEAVAIICPLISRAMDDQERSLEAVALDQVTAGNMFRLAFQAIFADWRDDPAVTLARVKSARITSRGRIPAILDGEKSRLGRSVEVTFKRVAFQAVVPAP